MTDSKENRRDEIQRAARIVLAVRLVTMIYEIVRTLVREHVLHGLGLGRLL